MRKRAFIIILQLIAGIVFCKLCCAQDVTYHEFQRKKFYYYRNSLALPDGKLLVIYGKNDWIKLSSNLDLIVHDNSGNVVKENLVALHNFGFELYFKDAFMVKRNLYFLCVNNIERTNDYNYVLVKLNTDSLTFHIEPMQFTNISAQWLFSGEYHLCFSPDSALVGVVTVSPMKPDFTKNALISIIDMNKLVISSSSAIPLGSNSNTFQMKDVAITNSGNVLMLVKYYIYGGSEIVENKSGYKYLLQLYAYGKLKRSLNVTPDTNLLHDAVMQLNKNDKKVMVVAYESKVISNNPIGIQLYEVNIDSMSINRSAFINWSQEPDTTLLDNSSYKIYIDYNYPYFIFLDNEKVIPVEGARITHNFDFHRGKLVCLETDSLLKVKELKEIQKYQFMEEMTDKPFIFNRNNSMVSYVQNENRNGKEAICFYNLDTGIQTKKELDHELWDVKNYYDILCTGDEVTLIQPQLTKYVLIKIKLK